MRAEELGIEDLRGLDLVAFSGHDRVQTSVAWLELALGTLPSICGDGARLSVIAALDGAGMAAAIPAVRTEALEEARPFPMDAQDLFFGLWIRHVNHRDGDLRRRAIAARLFGAALGRVNRSLGRALILHVPLAPASDALVARRLGPSAASAAIRAALGRARAIAADEGRCVVIPRLCRRDAEMWGGALEGFFHAATYPCAELPLDVVPEARTRQMIRRNARLLERAGVTVEIARRAPHDMPLGALFAETAGRHGDPVPRLTDTLFRAIGESFPGSVWYLSARRGGHPVGFVMAFARGAVWEAWKCGVYRSEAGSTPVYLDLVYGKLPELAMKEGGVRLELGAGQIGLKRRYGARVCAMQAHVALPPGFLGRRLFSFYAKAVGEGIAQAEGVSDQVASVATTPK